MPWDLVRDGESMAVDVDQLQDGEIEPLLAALKVQVADGVSDVRIVYREGADDNVVELIGTMLTTIESYGATPRVVRP
jgi:hypothetical protein